MNEITIKPPAADKPGYLRRFKALADVQARFNAGDLDAVDDAVNLILSECEVVVADDADPQEALLDLSKDDFYDAMSAVIGGRGVDPQSDD